jgi:hypothetical protein
MGDYVHGFQSITTSAGVAGWVCDLANFTPIGGGSPKGGRVRACMKRYASKQGYAPFIGFIQGTDPTASGYFVGLTDGTSYRLALKKGSPASGLNESDSGVLRTSDAGYTASGDQEAAWFHVQLDVLVNPNGDVVLTVKTNDLSSNPVTAPSFAAVAGMDSYIDDSLGVLTGSMPYTDSFYLMFGHYTSACQGAVSLFDHIEVWRQTSP